MKKPEDIQSILATDCGSTTTKAILIEKRDGKYRLVTRGEAPTTVEAPFDDVTVGVLNAVQEVEELRGRKMLRLQPGEGGASGGGGGEELRIIKPQQGEDGVDVYISTSSAGGGLQMMVAGVVRSMSAESAERAALGAGAIVMDTIATNDGRLPHERIERIRKLRPDMILLSGGVDGGTTTHVAEIAEMLAAADPKPRLGIGYQLPVVFAGNKDAAQIVRDAVGGKTALKVVDNIRPTLESENLQPARDEIHDLFLEHVMQQAPGYNKLISWTDAPIMPTPGAVGDIMETIAKLEKINVLGVDIGGATTDVFSVFGGTFNRTVSANLGMSYSISNVLSSAGIDNLARWVPFDIDERDLRNRIKNKMIRPTTIPQTLEDLQIEHAIAREALRLSLVQHKAFATELKGVQRQRTISDTFEQAASTSLVKMLHLDLLVGSGGVVSHAPRRTQGAMLLIEGFSPEGVTRLAVDSIFMMPQLGVLAQIHPQAALEVFHADCLIYLGTCIAPVGEGKSGREYCRFDLVFDGGRKESLTLNFGDLRMLPLPLDQICEMTAHPARGVDLGSGPGKEHHAKLEGGVVGLVFDGRGRPMVIPKDASARREALGRWSTEMDLYPQ